MEVLNAVFVAPFLDMADSPAFFFEVVIGGLMSGVMYSLVALGFVLIFKASSVFNFEELSSKNFFILINLSSNSSL